MNAPSSSSLDHYPITGRLRRYSLIVSLYLVSDIAFSFLFGALTTILLSLGHPKKLVALAPLFGVVYVLRFIAGPIIDRGHPSRKGPYRSWLWATRAALAASLAALSVVDPAHDLPLVFAGLMILLVFAALNDTATNGLAVRILGPTERGLGNGIQVAAATASIVLGTGGALFLYDLGGWRVTLLTLGALFAIPAAMLIGFREPAGEAPAAIQWSRIGTFFTSTTRRTFALIVAPLLVSGAYLVTAVQGALLLDRGWSLSDIATLQGVYAPVVGIIAGLAAGAAISRWGRARPLVVIGVAGMLSVAATLPIAIGDASATVAATGILMMSIGYAAIMTWTNTVYMDNSRADSSATDYSLQATILGLLRMIASTVGLALIPGFGYMAIVLVSVFLTFLGFGVAWRHIRAIE
ncbi:MFS transporter [Nocardia asteroides]|nr:MFS transporter [Nocardia asteroides]